MLKQIIVSVNYSLSFIYKSSKLLIVLHLLLTILLRTLPIAATYLFSYIIGRLSGDSSSAAFISQNYLLLMGTVYALLFVVTNIADTAVAYFMNLINQKLELAFNEDILMKLNDYPLSFIDSSKGHDLLEDVRYSQDALSFLYSGIINLCSMAYVVVFTFTALIRFNWFFTFLFVLITIPGILLDKVFEQKSHDFRIEKSPDARKFSYYRWMLTDVTPAKDVRMYNLTDPIQERYNEEKAKYLSANKAIEKQKLIYALLCRIVSSGGMAAFTIFVVLAAVHRTINLGDVVLYTGLAVSFNSSFQGALSSLVFMYTYAVKRIQPLLEFAKKSNEYNPEGGNKTFRKISEFQNLVFDNVFFMYPTSDQYVLKGASFRIEKGDKLSIVGMNGSGKSTIIKLMLGFYSPNSGQIFLNNHPMAEYDREQVCKLFSALFQTFVQYPLTLRENVALSNANDLYNDDLVVKALKKSDMYDHFMNAASRKKEDPLDLTLSRMFTDDGIELSKGQWQKIALSRAYYKDADIMILDEPSAALDPEAEDMIFNTIRDITGNKTCIMISHRLSSCRFSNKTIVLNNGVIEEYGSHDVLINNDGLYAALYNKQKEKYATSIN